MSPRGIDPKRTLAIVLGASQFPKARDLTPSSGFENSAADFRAYLTNSGGLNLPRGNTLNLFNDSSSSSEMLARIADFLLSAQQSASDELKPSDLMIYYVGHGGFSRDGQNYFLAVKATNEATRVASSIRIADLATVIVENARFMRRYIILDCCFAAEAYKAFQSVPGQLACNLVLDKIPGRGTALLCASGKNSPAIAPPNQRHTMFSRALLDSLRLGHSSLGPLISVEELADLIRVQLQVSYPDEWVRPEVHAPNQEEGNLARFPVFPNRSSRPIDSPVDASEAPGAPTLQGEPNVSPVPKGLLQGPKVDGATREVSPTVSLEELYAKAQEQFRRAQWSSALELLTLIRKRDPNFRNSTSLLQTARQNENIENLWAESEKAIEARRWETAALALQVLVRVDVGNRDKAQQRLQYVLNATSKG